MPCKILRRINVVDVEKLISNDPIERWNRLKRLHGLKCPLRPTFQECAL